MVEILARKWNTHSQYRSRNAFGIRSGPHGFFTSKFNSNEGTPSCDTTLPSLKSSPSTSAKFTFVCEVKNGWKPAVQCPSANCKCFRLLPLLRVYCLIGIARISEANPSVYLVSVLQDLVLVPFNSFHTTALSSAINTLFFVVFCHACFSLHFKCVATVITCHGPSSNQKSFSLTCVLFYLPFEPLVYLRNWSCLLHWGQWDAHRFRACC